MLINTYDINVRLFGEIIMATGYKGLRMSGNLKQLNMGNMKVQKGIDFIELAERGLITEPHTPTSTIGTGHKKGASGNPIGAAASSTSVDMGNILKVSTLSYDYGEVSTAAEVTETNKWAVRRAFAASRARENAIQPALPGGVLFEGQYPALYTTWIAPEGVTSVCVLAVGRGGNGSHGGGAGGGLVWANDIPVIPGNSYDVVIDFDDNSSYNAPVDTGSYFIDPFTVMAFSGKRGSGFGDLVAAGGGFRSTVASFGGGHGGSGGPGRIDGTYNPSSTSKQTGGGGGAGGYSGNGGDGGGTIPNGGPGVLNGQAGSGGGGGGGAKSPASFSAGAQGTGFYGGGGGGVGLYGEGASGAGGTHYNNSENIVMVGNGGSGGQRADHNGDDIAPFHGVGGKYGGGATGAHKANGQFTSSFGAAGAVRIIWGANRAFPSTNVGPSDELPGGEAETLGV